MISVVVEVDYRGPFRHPASHRAHVCGDKPARSRPVTLVPHDGHATVGARLVARLSQCFGAICVPKLGRPQREREISFLVCQHLVHPRSVGPVPSIKGVLDGEAKHLANQCAGNVRDQASLRPIALNDAHLRKVQGIVRRRLGNGLELKFRLETGAPSG